MTESRISINQTHPKGLNIFGPMKGELMALLFGACFTLAFAPFEWVIFAPLSLVVLLYSVYLPYAVLNKKRAFLRGYLWGVGAYLGGVHWVFNSMHDFGGASVMASACFTIFLVLYMAVYPALLALGLYCVRHRTRHTALIALAFALLLGVTEWARSFILTGFPWLMTGYALVDSPFAALMPWVGSLGASVWCAFMLALLGLWVLNPRRYALITVCALILCAASVFLAGRVNWAEGHVTRTMSVAALQGNVPQNIKMNPNKRYVSLNTYAQLTELVLGADLILWPETAIPTLAQNVHPYLQSLDRVAKSKGSALVLGTFERSDNGRDWHNAMLVIGNQAKTEGWASYKKYQLVPFGEYMPLRWVMKVFSYFVDIPQSDMAKGPYPDKPMRIAGVPMAPHICYETAYPDVIRKQAMGAELLLNISNDAWFGRLIAPHQHLQMARVRAVEFAKPLVRATNTGISALVDAQGRVIKRSEQDKIAVVKGSLHLNNVVTPFTCIGQMWLGWLLLLGLVVLFLSLFFNKDRCAHNKI